MLSLLWFPTTRCEDSAGGASYEAGLNQRTIVLEFDSVERAIAAFKSDAYKAALKVLGNGAERDIRLVEGVVAKNGNPSLSEAPAQREPADL